MKSKKEQLLVLNMSFININRLETFQIIYQLIAKNDYFNFSSFLKLKVTIEIEPSYVLIPQDGVLPKDSSR